MVVFTNRSVNADRFRWDYGDGTTGATDAVEEPGTHEYTEAGTYTVTLTAIQEGETPLTSSANVIITVKHGPPERLSLTPAAVEMNIGQTQEFSTEVFDAYGNTIPDAELTWNVTTEAGTITNDGTLTAGTKAGTFEEAVAVTVTLDGDTLTATTSVTVKPGPLGAVRVSSIQVGAGQSKGLSATATDEHGNSLSGVDMTWTVTNTTAGSVTSGGSFKAGTVPGTYSGAVKVTATQGGVTKTASAGVTITPGPLVQVYIAPTEADVGMEMTQQFVAAGVDRYDNRIAGLRFTWSVEKGAGTIDGNGLFTAGTTPGDYASAVKAEATSGGATQSITANVIVEPDRIAFTSDRNDDQWDIYIMDMDGANVERLTDTSASEYVCSWSPDGHRIVYAPWDFEDGITIVNDDGGWKHTLIENDIESRVVYVYPAWSPDGRIAFIRATVDARGYFDEMDLFVMDLDGSNVTQVTDTTNGTEWMPAWSPDGTKIVYDFTPIGGLGHICTINADGSSRQSMRVDLVNDTNPAWSPDGTTIAFQSYSQGGYEIFVMNINGSDPRQLTSNSRVDDVEPNWSPDGNKIVFCSDRDTGDNTQLYVMDADGTNVTRLTDNTATDRYPVWAPRKKGVPVTEASLVIPGGRTGEDMTAEEVTAQARDAVVRIKTDLLFGSGFVISPDGLILTNNHVIKDAEEITVYFDDGTNYTGTVEARDLVRDLALVRIEATGLSHLEMGSPGEASLGQQVLVLGYPLGNENVSVTSGLVSAIEFDYGTNITWVQTDSAVNPGNSGGPMLNLQGRVIGVVSAKMVGVAVEGIGFAISVGTVNMYLSRLEAGETIATY